MTPAGGRQAGWMVSLNSTGSASLRREMSFLVDARESIDYGTVQFKGPVKLYFQNLYFHVKEKLILCIIIYVL